MPPYEQRNAEQLKQTYSGKHKEKGDKTPSSVRTTTLLATASQIKFVPRIYTVDYTPIMRCGQEASIREWGWPEDMPLDDFLDTVIYMCFKEHGITLNTYSVDTTEDKEKVEEEKVPVGEGD